MYNYYLSISNKNIAKVKQISIMWIHLFLPLPFIICVKCHTCVKNSVYLLHFNKYWLSMIRCLSLFMYGTRPEQNINKIGVILLKLELAKCCFSFLQIFLRHSQVVSCQRSFIRIKRFIATLALHYFITIMWTFPIYAVSYDFSEVILQIRKKCY